MSDTRWRIILTPQGFLGYRGLHYYYGDTIGDVMDMIHETEPTA